MDKARTVDDHQDQEIRNDNVFILFLSSLVRIPLRILHSFSSITLATLRPYAPQIVPILICLLFIPLVVILSISAGFVVWKNFAVDWETPVHLQFGYVLATVFIVNPFNNQAVTERPHMPLYFSQHWCLSNLTISLSVLPYLPPNPIMLLATL